MGTKSAYNWRGTGRMAFWDAATYETFKADYPINFYDDFIGADVVIPATGAVESGCKWSKKITANATVAKTADGVNGLVDCSLTNASEAQEGALQMNDELMFSIAQGAIFEARLSLTTLPTLNGVASFGLHGAYAAGGSNFRVGFEIPAGGLCACESDDNATDTSASSGSTLVAGTYYIFRIDCTDQTNIKFFINGLRVASSTTFANAASASNSKCQPHFGMYKASGAGLGVISVDYVKIWQDRS